MRKNHKNPRKFNNGKKNAVDFDTIKLNAIHPKGYTLYCAAKDIYLGTRHLTVSDLIDMNLVTPKLFGVITNAMAIRRFGMRAFAVSEHMYHASRIFQEKLNVGKQLERGVDRKLRRKIEKKKQAQGLRQ